VQAKEFVVIKAFGLALFLLAGVVALASPPAAVADGELTLQITGVDASAYPNVKFFVTAVDSDGLSLGDLRASDFIVEAGERRLPVSSVQGITDGQVGISALLSLDTSGSMVGAPITAAREAASSFITTLRPIDEVAVVSFADRVVVASPYTQDFRGAQAAITGLQAVGNTALYQAVADSAKWASERGAARRVVILLSDGADFGGVSPTTRQQSIDAAWSVGVPFFVIGLGNQIDRQYLQDLANATRGRLFIAPSATQLRQVFSEIGQQVRTQYAVTLDLSKTPIEGDVGAKLTVRRGAKSGTAEFAFNVPNLVPQEVQVAPALEGDGVRVPGWLVLSLLALAGAGGMVFAGRRLATSRAASRDAAFVPASVFHARQTPDRSEEASEVLGRLVAAGGETYELTRRLISLGGDADSTYRLPQAGPSAGSLRVWLANEHFMVHDTSPRVRMKLNGNSAKWGVLRDGDQVEFGGVKLRFESVGGIRG
jgi:Mg-chelatase subunit ChlD